MSEIKLQNNSWFQKVKYNILLRYLLLFIIFTSICLAQIWFTNQKWTLLNTHTYMLFNFMSRAAACNIITLSSSLTFCRKNKEFMEYKIYPLTPPPPPPPHTHTHTIPLLNSPAPLISGGFQGSVQKWFWVLFMKITAKLILNSELCKNQLRKNMWNSPYTHSKG